MDVQSVDQTPVPTLAHTEHQTKIVRVSGKRCAAQNQTLAGGGGGGIEKLCDTNCNSQNNPLVLWCTVTRQ